MSDHEEKKKSKKSVTLVSDPFQIKTHEIAEAQDREDELDLDQELEDDREPAELNLEDDATVNERLESLAKAMSKEQREQIEELTELAPEDAEASAARLAAQIAEDEALARALIDENAQLSADADPEVLAAMPSGTDEDEIKSCIEALLFMTDKPMSAEKIREHLGPELKLSLFQEAITSLMDDYKKVNHGIELVKIAGGYQLRTKPIRAPLAKKLAKIQTQRLSSGAMETLAIVSYKQPVLKEDIDKIRGVDSSHFIRGLLDKKLIKISGRSELPGRPMEYATTQEFLEVFGLSDLNAMPALRELEQMVPNTQVGDDEDPRLKEMRKMVSEMKSSSDSIMDYDPKEDEKFLKDIREKVNSISITTQTLQAQEAEAKGQPLPVLPPEPKLGEQVQMPVD